MTKNLEARLTRLEKERAPKGRHFYVWKGSEAHRDAELKAQPGDVIHVISWLDKEPSEAGAHPLRSNVFATCVLRLPGSSHDQKPA
jgi:hypothetical protein